MAITIDELNCSSDTHSSYSVNINDDKIYTIVTHTPSVVNEYISTVLYNLRHGLDPLLVGLDAEWTLNSESGKRNPVCTLQLCVDHKCLIFHLIHSSEIPQSLIDFLNNPTLKFVGVAIRDDVTKLFSDYGLQVANAIDLRTLAADKLYKKELRNSGLKSLAKEVLDWEIPKPKNITMSTWDAEFLTNDQVQYACVDAFISFEIGRKLMEFK